jgi:Flp pilus assembly protein TadB
MPVNAAMFLFLAAAVVAVFAFLSIAVWVTGPTHERLARERLALLRTIAENQNENAKEVLEMLRREDDLRAARKAREERKGWVLGGLIVIAVGVGLGIMMIALEGGRTWSIALIPLLIGCVLVGAGLYTNPDRGSK